MSEPGAIPMLRPGETVGPFTIEIPHHLIVYLEFKRRTTRWERFLWDRKLMSSKRRREVAMRMVDLLGIGT